MTVYVDGMRARFGRMVMCHMLADTTAELLAMADRIGVQRKWLQQAGTYREHFDIALSKRRLAVEAGALEIDARTLGHLLHQRRALLPASAPARVGHVLEERERLHAEDARERFEGAHVDPLDGLAGQEPVRDGAGEAGADGELVRVRPAPLRHVGVEVPADHAPNLAYNAPVDQGLTLPYNDSVNPSQERPMPDPTTTPSAFSPHTARCQRCHERFRVTHMQIATLRQDYVTDPAATDAQVAAMTDFCLGCLTGAPVEGEKDGLRTCEGAQTENGPDCDGEDVRTVTAKESADSEPVTARWCAECRSYAEWQGWTILSVEDAR